MTTSASNEKMICKSIVPIIVTEQSKGFGFFVAPNMLLTCAHVICDSEDNSFENASVIKIQWGNQRLPAQVESKATEVDLALLSVELTDHPYLPLCEDVVSFEVLRVHGHTTLTVKGFAGDTEKIMLEASGDDIGRGDSGRPLFNPRTGSVCGLISGGNRNTKTIEAIHIKKALKSFPELANTQDDIQNLPSQIRLRFLLFMLRLTRHC